MSGPNEKNLPKAKRDASTSSTAFRSYTEALKASPKENAASAEAHGEGSRGHQHGVEVVEQEGVVSKIKVTCKCGEVIEIVCDYTEK